MARKLKRKIRRSINRTRKLTCCIAGGSLFAGLLVMNRLPGVTLIPTDASEKSREQVTELGYENYVSSRKLAKRPFFAHRGFSSLELENSFSSFDLAVHMGFEQLEMDIWKSADGILYVCHDNSLKNAAGKNLKITETESSVLDGIRLSNGDKLPRLSEVFDEISSNAVYLIELKNGKSDVKALAELLKEYESIQHSICLQAWDLETLAEIESEFPYMFTMFLMPGLDRLDQALEDDALSGLAIQYQQLDRKTVDRIHESGKQVWAWTVNKNQQIQEMVQLGVDGIISDNPDKVVQAFEHYSASGQ